MTIIAKIKQDDPESQRLTEAAARKKHWRRWGPYLSERQWGTVREDYSVNGDAWNFLTHDMARAYTYRWGEDGLAGLSDNHQRLCFAMALWNGEDPILKERLFGLTNSEGNHGEDLKEYYWYLDATPTHSYMRLLYRYPQSAFPYQQLVEENARLDRTQPEFELIATGVFDANRFFDVSVEYAKANVEDILIRITAVNRGPKAAPLHLLPTLWFRNDWSWQDGSSHPLISPSENNSVVAVHSTLGTRYLGFTGSPEMLFTENESNREKLFGVPNLSLFVKDAFHRFVVNADRQAVSPGPGTKFAPHYHWMIPPGEKRVIQLRLSDGESHSLVEGPDFDEIFEKRQFEADLFYERFVSPQLSEDQRKIQRQSYAGMLWSKQWYHYVVEDWLKGDPTMPSPPPERLKGRNSKWLHLYNDDVLAMPDKWEFPWYAVWDSAFHAITLSLLDPDFAKQQLDRFTREWYMHPNGQVPAYEWSFDDVNPPVHAWATYRVYKIEEKHFGRRDVLFLERIFQKLLMNFTWWVNRKDQNGRNLFEGGFMGMDNIGVFDRSASLPIGGNLLQSDSTSWMAMYCLNMLRIAWELAQFNPAYEDTASKFYEHFLYIANAMSIGGKDQPSLWDGEDGFFYDHLNFPDGKLMPIRIRSMVGLVPLLAVETLSQERLGQMPGFRRRMEWFEKNRPNLTHNISCIYEPHGRRRCILSILKPDQLTHVLRVMLDENEFLSRFGIRSLSKYHEEHPYRLETDSYSHTVRYEPAESSTSLFGGNSNWRGPIWFPLNFLIIESLQKYHYFWGDNFKVEFPTGSGQLMTLEEVACQLCKRLISIFEEKDGRRPVFGDAQLFQENPLWQDLIPFYEYFNGDTGAGLGASHQTGWTALVAKLIFQSGEQS